MVISVKWTCRTRLWLVVMVAAVVMVQVMALSGPNVCMVKQKYNITKRIKYRAPMSVRTYEWCFSMPPRCSKWNTEMRDLTRLETEERTAEVAVCCPGYKMKDVACVPICPHGKTGTGCSEDCQPRRWGPNCVNECKDCSEHGDCSPVTGECQCRDGWQGESCETMSTSTSTTTTTTTPAADLLTFSKTATKPTTLPTTAFTLITTPTSTVVPSTTSLTTSSTATSTVTTQRIPIKPQILLTTTKQMDITTATLPTETTKLTSTYRAITPEEENQMTFPTFTEETTQRIKEESSIYNRTVPPKAKESTYPTEIILPTTTIKSTTAKLQQITTTKGMTTTQSSIVTFPMTVQDLTTTSTPKTETTRKQETTIKNYPTTLKFKPKEIWIRPAQKEPEHITAVMSEKGTERSSIDLVSVISIVGGVMMAVITVAVIIVMIERCKKPRYEDVRKINDIRMQVMIDNSDIPPPPYVRSIFHTPLPDPPSLEKCHYQPISTLDRNLKQFMRPVVVQTISPVMLENFRGILECHYDHLPRRSHDFGPPSVRCSITPSINTSEQLRLQRTSLTESAIESLKCEAKLDVIDNTTSEPLYAEIPCWRPPSEHAIEVINIQNGEAVTEL